MRTKGTKPRRPRTLEAKPAATSRAVPQRERGTLWVQGDPEAVRPLVRGEGMPVFVAGVLLALLALSVSYRRGYTLLYGDAVAHLGNARRILDAHYPGISQLGGAWLPLPHVLMLPFIGNMAMWQTGLAAAPMSMVSFAASVVGVWRLARRMMRLRWAGVATLLYALNPNLLYLATTALTEALFLALFVWAADATVEAVAAVRAGNAPMARARMFLAGLLVLGMVFTRYDGWVIGAAVWVCLLWAVMRSEATARRRLWPAFAVFTAMCAAGPLLWVWYNAHFDGDWLDFLRGPYSAKGVEARSSRPGQHYPGWHEPMAAAVRYLRTVGLDAAAWNAGVALLAAAFSGVWVSLGRKWGGTRLGKLREEEAVGGRGQLDVVPERVPRMGSAVHAGVPGVAERFGLLLWLPLPFYAYSVAFGSVPIFIPQMAPHAFYNVRYGMELLPALCVYAALAGEAMDVWMRSGVGAFRRWGAPFCLPAAVGMCVANSLLMMYGFGSAGFLRSGAERAREAREAFAGGYLPEARTYAYPLVLAEGLVNAQTRVPFEHALANVLQTLPPGTPVLMSVSAHVGAVQDAGRELRSVVSENDDVAWRAALADPAHRAAYVIALEGDPVAAAVAAHPAGLGEIEVVRTVGQPTARVYQSLVYGGLVDGPARGGASQATQQATH